MRQFAKHLFLTVLTITFFGCSSDSDKSSGNDIRANWVNWDSVPSEFNPRIEEKYLDLGAAQRVKLNLFNFDDDVRVIYSSEQPVGRVTLKIFKVYKNSASWGSISTSQKSNAIEVNNYGSYACSIQVKNGAITALDGGCYVRVEVVMPVNAQVEVYNREQLLTQRFVAMSLEELIDGVKNASWAEQKLLVMDNFLQSHQETKKTPVLLAQHMGEILEEMSFAKDKFTALRKLHAAVVDRENLPAMIEKQFGVFDRDEALQIVGM